MTIFHILILSYIICLAIFFDEKIDKFFGRVIKFVSGRTNNGVPDRGTYNVERRLNTRLTIYYFKMLAKFAGVLIVAGLVVYAFKRMCW